jgi:hypothetical protein
MKRHALSGFQIGEKKRHVLTKALSLVTTQPGEVTLARGFLAVGSWQ